MIDVSNSSQSKSVMILIGADKEKTRLTKSLDKLFVRKSRSHLSFFIVKKLFFKFIQWSIVYHKPNRLIIQ
jgi:hypothetical protein